MRQLIQCRRSTKRCTIELPDDFYSILPDMEYGASMFVVGFVVGMIRILLVVPLIGPIVAGILEIPLMLAICFVLSKTGILCWQHQHTNVFFMLFTSAYLATAGNSAFHAIVP